LFVYTKNPLNFNKEMHMADDKKATASNVGFLADIDAKIAALQALRASFIAAQKAGVSLGSIAGGMTSASVGEASLGDPAMPTELPEGAFLGKSIPQAIKLHLSAARKKQTVKEITTALREGGVESSAENFETVVTGSLNRLKIAGEVLRFKDGWGLSEWYPAHLRGTSPAAGNGSKKKKKAKKGAAAKAAKTAKAEAPQQKLLPTAITIEKASEIVAGTGSEQPGKEDQIFQLFKGGRELSSKDVTAELGMRSQTVTFLLGKLAYKHKLQKTESGNYKVAAVTH
jgi:hypothetical protein